MAFDQSTRGRLQKLVNSCRGLLSDEFSIQLQQTYGLDPKTGEVTPMARLTHLDDRQRHTAKVLRQTLAHYLGADVDDTDHRIAVLDRMVREQAFTVLNRLAALLMMEARGQFPRIEILKKGYQSSGYQLYSKIAGTALGETGQAYQVYLFSVFDELAQELPALFDRYAANGLLFPRETALRALLDELNHFEIEPLWAADETIGWIYQYFNSKEERKAMRDASQAPRNSRELAVRNQFFTPRYVVEFLVDNTLGRLWFKATGGQTGLRERCQYLLVKPDEQAPAANKLRDPRTLKLLDPACGSMHFGLYAFDLFAEIYREAWAWERQNGPGSLDLSAQPQASLKPLSHTYEDEAAFLRDVPRLIIEHNIYGVDIDPRAVQIASLALWLRAQRAWHDADVKAKDRPLICRGHVVAAIAPPAERELCLQFASNLDQRDAELFEKTLKLLKAFPELGVLLQVERELSQLIRQIFVGKGTGLFAKQEKESWQHAESRLRVALTEFAQTAKSTYQERLFAQDALQGLRLIDLCREAFDVVVMNPPFGLVPEQAFSYLSENYPDTYVDAYGSFVTRGFQLIRNGGYVGAITSRTFIASKKLIRWREDLISKLLILADLGDSVMDDALVRSAAYILSKSQYYDSAIDFLDCRKTADKNTALLDYLGCIKRKSPISVEREFFSKLPGVKLLYDVPSDIDDLFESKFQFEPSIGTVRKGLTTFDDFRYLRLWWEVMSDKIGKGLKWEYFAKGGEYSVYYTDIHLVVDRENDGAELAETNRIVNGQVAQSRQASSFYYRPGVQFTTRSAIGFSARAIPKNCTWSSNAPLILSTSTASPEVILGWVNCRLIRTLIEIQSTADDFVPNSVKCLPWKDPDNLDEISADVRWLHDAYKNIEGWIETDVRYVSPFSTSGITNIGVNESQRQNLKNQICARQSKLSEMFDSLYGIDTTELATEVLERNVDAEVPSEALGNC